MPQRSVNGTRLYFEDSGGSGPPVLFSHGLLYSCRMWDAQVPSLRSRFRCICYDHRGQGQSEVAAGGYDMDTVSEDAAALIRALDVQPVHFVGLSMGGFVGMRLAARHPELLRSLVLLDTSAEGEPAENLPRYRLLNFLERWVGPRVVAGSVMKIMHGATVRADASRASELRAVRDRFLALDRIGAVRAVNGVLERKAILDELARIRLPTLVMVGEEDVAVVPAKAEALAAAIAGARLVRIPKAGHLSPIDNPGFVTEQLSSFLGSFQAA
ncbi:MAG: alpha/beta fold hydrolase [Myxococcaceae bacterium]